MLDRVFQLKQYGTTVRTEVVAGLTTFMTMAYIIALNPAILCLDPSHPGPPFAATVAATCIAAAIPTLLMGLWANYPIALASGMGLNSLLVITVGSIPGVTWRTMMGVVFVEGAIITLLVLTKLRSAVMDAIPLDLKRAIGVGIGLFIAMLGMHNGHWISTSKPVGGLPFLLTPTGNFHQPATWVATIGVIVTAVLLARKVKGALLLGIVVSTVIAIPLGITHMPTAMVSAPDFSTFGRLDIIGALRPALFGLIFAFLITDFFDTMGTVIAIGEQSGRLASDGSMRHLNRVLLVDSLAAMWGGLSSASSSTSYIESASGVSEGGRTGLVNVVVAVLFLLAMFFAPLIGVVPLEATAGALIIVGFLMMTNIKEIDFRDYASAIPAFLVMIVIPLTMSISRGIGTGFVAYALVRLLTGRAREVPWLLWIIAALFVLSFWLEKA